MKTITELSAAELDALIERVKEAAEHGLALSGEDLQLLLSAIVTLAELQERMAESDITRTTASGKGFLPTANRLYLLACAAEAAQARRDREVLGEAQCRRAGSGQGQEADEKA